MNTFLNKDFLKVSITFDGLIYFIAEERIIVYEQIALI
jgi:hypothetical protein